MLFSCIRNVLVLRLCACVPLVSLSSVCTFPVSLRFLLGGFDEGTIPIRYVTPLLNVRYWLKQSSALLVERAWCAVCI